MDNLPSYKQVGLALLLIRFALACEFLWQMVETLQGLISGPGHGRGAIGFAEHAHLPPVGAAALAITQMAAGMMVLTGVGARAGAALLCAFLLIEQSSNGYSGAPELDHALTNPLALCAAIIIAGAGPLTLSDWAHSRVARWTRSPFC